MSFRYSPRLAAFVLLLVTACSQPADLTAPSPDLAPQFGTAGDDSASIVVADAERGRVYLAGTANASLENYTRGTPFFRRYDRAGRLVWERRMSRPGSVTGAAVGPGGSVVFGWRTTKNFVTKYTAAGTRLFQLVLRDFGVNDLTVDLQGNIYVGGGSEDDTGPTVRKYGPAGKLLWEARFSVEPGDDGFGPPMLGVADLAATPGGSLYLAGTSVDDFGYLVKLRSRDGAVLGQKQVFGSGVEIEAVGNDAVYLRTAYEDTLASGGDFRDYRVYKFRPDLSTVWLRDDLISGDDRSANGYSLEDDTYGIGTDAHGNVFLTGAYLTDDERDTDLFVRKLSAAGGLVFDRRVAVPGSNAAGYGVAALGPGKLYLVGATGGRVNGKNYGGEDAFLIRTDGQGREVWAR